MKVDRSAGVSLERTGEVRGKSHENRGEQTAASRAGEERAGSKCRRRGQGADRRDAEVEGESRGHVGELPEGGDAEMAEVGIVDDLARHPRLGRRQLLRAVHRVQKREVHRLLAPVDLGIAGANGEKKEKRREKDDGAGKASRPREASGEGREPGGHHGYGHRLEWHKTESRRDPGEVSEDQGAERRGQAIAGHRRQRGNCRREQSSPREQDHREGRDPQCRAGPARFDECLGRDRDDFAGRGSQHVRPTDSP